MDEKLQLSLDALIEALGKQSAFWGLGKTAGEMYAVLYFNDGPLSLEQIADKLQVTKGNISIAIRQLEQLGMVKRSQQKGDRRVFFTAETDFWKITHSVLWLRHKPEFEQTFALVKQSVQLAESATSSKEKEVITKRLQSLQEFYCLLDGVVEKALAMKPNQLKTMFGILESFILKRRPQ